MPESRIQIIRRDITQQPDVAAIVNAANAELAPGGGVAGAIHTAAGPDLHAKAKPHAPIQPGECVLTGACNLPNTHVIHCLAPRYGIDHPAAQLLERAYRCALKTASEAGIPTVAFPSLGTGAFGYPIEEAAAIALRVAQHSASKYHDVRLIRFVLFTEADRIIFARHANQQ